MFMGELRGDKLNDDVKFMVKVGRGTQRFRGLGLSCDLGAPRAPTSRVMTQKGRCPLLAEDRARALCPGW